MKREIKYLIIVLGLIGFVCAVLLYWNTGSDTESDTTFSKAPSRLTMLGPYAKNVNLTENVGVYSLTISAEKLFMKKGKIMGFSTALHKKFETDHFRMALYRNGEKKLELSKDRVNLDSFMRTIEIESPRVLYPETMDQPVKVRLEKEKKKLTIHYAKKTDTWDLTQ